MLNIIAPNRNIEAWIDAIISIDNSIEITTWPEINSEAKMVLCWKPPDDIWTEFENLQCISSMGAGVDGLVDNPTIPKHIPIVRLVDDELKHNMYCYIRHCLESYRLKQDSYQQAKQNKQWSPLSRKSQHEITVSILGFGEIGQYVAEHLLTEGYIVNAWKQTPAAHEQLSLYSGWDGLQEMLAHSNVVVCLLPLTAKTNGILNKTLFDRLPDGAALIQVARGAHLNEIDLSQAVTDGKLSKAYLDVFSQEPLPEDHMFWLQPNIHITPHIASVTDPISVAPQIVSNYQNLLANKPLLNLVDKARGY